MFGKSVLSPFLEVLQTFGNKPAFCIAGNYYTYSEFARHISKIRKKIQSVISNKNLGLVVNDDIETYASIFALWLDGLAYVPLHPNQPLERSLEIIYQADIDLVIDSCSENRFPKLQTVKTTGLEFEELLLQPTFTSDEALAYILFTSGSTGKPKGVQITRRNVGAFMNSFWKTPIQITSSDRCLQCFDLTFDVSVQSFLVPLTKGACTYTVPHDQIKYSYVYGLLEDHKITFGAMAPSMLRFLRPYFKEISLPDMKYNILTAEASPVDLIEQWSKCIPNAEIYDFYGPTEATIYCTYHKYNRLNTNKQLNGMLCIGTPMVGVKAIVIDEDKQILGTNKKGELCISGDQLTPGYWKNPEKNAQSFFETDYENINTRFYRTGDSCYIDEDGDILLSGRLDYQVKIQGYRIELGEIEYHARDFLHGQNAVAVTFQNTSGNSEIALFIENDPIDQNYILEHLKAKMPFYMVPAKILFNEKFPLNANGKTDRNKLKESIV